MTPPKIKPCPNCGNLYCAIYAYENGWQHVECDECHYLGPGEGSKLAAIQAHNLAQGTEAQRATTVEQGVVHDGPVAKPCAHTSSGGGK